MECDIDRWYTFCEEHMARIKQDGDRVHLEAPDTCDWRTVKGRCKKVAPWEFYVKRTSYSA